MQILLRYRIDLTRGGLKTMLAGLLLKNFACHWSRKCVCLYVVCICLFGCFCGILSVIAVIRSEYLKTNFT